MQSNIHSLDSLYWGSLNLIWSETAIGGRGARQLTLFWHLLLTFIGMLLKQLLNR